MTHFDRNNPFFSCIQERILLNRKGSTKRTYHLSLSLDQSSITYRPGDCVAILPSNALEDVEAIYHLLHLKDDDHQLRDFLTKKANLQKPHPALIRKIYGENHQNLSGFSKSLAPADLIALHQNISINPQEIPQLFLPLLPRLYSIASSQLMFPKEMHLLIALVHYHHNGKERKGVASRFLCEEAVIKKTIIPLYVQRSHNFLLPEDPNISIIMVGSGTGLAPFRAFMQQRLATRATGRNWLFLGERNRNTDYYYEDFFEELQQQQLLRLSLAFSRDHAEKIYVQNRMWEERKDLWAWIKDGAYFYVCGDANCMAKDVETMFHRIAMSEGHLSEQEAHGFIKNLRALKCYRTDVY
jgi:sulfite reductase (NADPH) flavoprotein alpha-component